MSLVVGLAFVVGSANGDIRFWRANTDFLAKRNESYFCTVFKKLGFKALGVWERLTVWMMETQFVTSCGTNWESRPLERELGSSFAIGSLAAAALLWGSFCKSWFTNWAVGTLGKPLTVQELVQGSRRRSARWSSHGCLGQISISVVFRKGCAITPTEMGKRRSAWRHSEGGSKQLSFLTSSNASLCHSK